MSMLLTLKYTETKIKKCKPDGKKSKTLRLFTPVSFFKYVCFIIYLFNIVILSENKHITIVDLFYFIVYIYFLLLISFFGKYKSLQLVPQESTVKVKTVITTS